jgi:hypothetical protein
MELKCRNCGKSGQCLPAEDCHLRLPLLFFAVDSNPVALVTALYNIGFTIRVKGDLFDIEKKGE